MRGIQMKEKEELAGRLPWFSSQLHFPTGRRDFCPYLALIRSVMALVRDGNLFSILILL